VLVLFLVLAFRGLRIATVARDPFEALLAVGLTSTLAIQALVIIGGNLRLMPLTGVTLPFMSYGGSSLLANFVAIGLLLRISAQQREAA
jgi:peptidoglycan glycosyltransferase